MTSRKKTRAVIDFPYATQMEDPGLWYERAVSFHKAAVILYKECTHDKTLFLVTVYNSALSLELIIKSILTEQRKLQKHHKLCELAEAIGLKLSDDLRASLDLFSDILLWLGCYPVPTEEVTWDDFYKGKINIIRRIELSGNISSSSADHDWYASFDNYLKLWEVFRKEYQRNRPSSF